MAKAKTTKGRTTAPGAKAEAAKRPTRPGAKAGPASTPPGPRAQIAAAQAAMDDGRAQDVDLDALHGAFEALRAEAEQPAELFALAVEEARAIDAYAEKTRSGTAHLVASLSRVLEGAAGTRPRDLAWATARLETALRSAAARTLDDAAHARSLAALVDGFAHAGDVPAARGAASRWIKRAAKDGADRSNPRGVAEHDRAIARAFELAIEAHDLDDAIKWCRARVAAMTATGAPPGVLADGLAPLWRLWADQGSPKKALEAARAWVDAERRAQLREPARAGRLVDALAGLSQAALLAEDAAAWADATAAWVEHARAQSGVEREVFPRYGAARLAEALAMQTEVFEHRGEALEALRAARAWQAAEREASPAGTTRAARTAVASEGAVRATTAVVRALDAIGDAERCAPESEALLELLARGTEAQPARKSAAIAAATEARAAVAQLGRAASARAHFGTGAYARAAERAREWVERSAGGEPEACVVMTVLATAEELALPARAGVARTRAIEALVARARKLTTALEALPRARREAAARATALAFLARAEALAGSNTLAQRHADEAVARLREVRATAPREARGYVAWVHESLAVSTPIAPARKPGARSADAATTAARALAAAQAGARARACGLLGAIDESVFASEPDTLAHTLAASAHVLTRVAPGDPVLAEGLAAWEAIARLATLPGGRPEAIDRG